MCKSIKAFLLVFFVPIVLTGCAGSLKQNSYQTGAVQMAMKVDLATVVASRDVEIEAKGTGTGTLAGGAIGGIAGASLASGSANSSIAGAIAGAVVGGVAGHFAEKGASSKTGVEIVYTIDKTGETEALVQEKDDVVYAVGDKVRIMRGGISVRAVKL